MSIRSVNSEVNRWWQREAARRLVAVLVAAAISLNTPDVRVIAVSEAPACSDVRELQSLISRLYRDGRTAGMSCDGVLDLQRALADAICSSERDGERGAYPSLTATLPEAASIQAGTAVHPFVPSDEMWMQTGRCPALDACTPPLTQESAWRVRYLFRLTANAPPAMAGTV